MCELFGASAGGALPAECAGGFVQRAAAAAAPADGWGVAYQDGAGFELAKAASAANPADLERAMALAGSQPGIVVAHLRKATQGGLAVANTQPFVRERWGSAHAFAHNGDLDAQALHAAFPLRRERPLGETDSEYAFCLLLEWLEPLWRAGTRPSIERRFEVVTRFAAMLRPLGPFNFLYSDGDALFAHAHRRMQPGGRIAPPGLQMRRERAHGDVPGRVGFASVPLSPRGWMPMRAGELVAVRRGKLVCAVEPRVEAGEPARRSRRAHAHCPCCARL